MSALSDELSALVGSVTGGLRELSGSDVKSPRSAGGWSEMEILGHLVDSAANNHQRFVRAQHVATLEYPSYDQEAWVASQRYADADWSNLVELWLAYNRHLAHVLSVMPPEQLDTPVRVDWYGEPTLIPLSRVADEYLVHVRHHLEQLLPGAC